MVVAVAGLYLGLLLLFSAPNPDDVIKPLLPELAKDNLTAYLNAAEKLNTTAGKYKDSGKLRLRAAELVLTAVAAHGGTPDEVARAEALLQEAGSQPKPTPVLGRARALLALTKGNSKEAENALADRAAAENQLVVGIINLADNKMTAARDALRRYVTAKPTEALGHYLLGKALVASAGPEARKEFEWVLAKNPAHIGAKIGLARLEETAEKRLAAARAIADKKAPAAGSTELADLHLLIGQSAQAMGRSPEAIAAFELAIASDKRLTAAYLGMGETLLYEGKYPEALERLKSVGKDLESSPAGKFNMGGALIATGAATQGLALVDAASKERPQDPRGPFWRGFAADQKQPPDLVAAEQGYRDAIKQDPTFLPPYLKFAALLQRQNRANDSLDVLREAQEAGAPLAALQLAWGEALIVAKEPAKAETIFRKALDEDPKSVSAHLGVATALEAQEKVAEAKASLEKSLKDSPELPGLRQRLAQVCLKLGDKEGALANLQGELQTSRPTPTLRLAIAGLALDLGKIDIVRSESAKVLAVSQRNAEAAYYMARAYEARNETGAALQEYRRATTWGNTPQFAYSYGHLLAKLGRLPEALLSFANAVTVPEARLERGRLYYRAGDMTSALADFQAASLMTPGSAEPLILQGLCYDKTGNAAKAEEAWRAALRVDPESPEPHYRLGRSDLDHVKLASAIEHLRIAGAKVPEDADWRPDIYFQLAQAELLSGAKAAALTDFKKFLEIAPPDAPTRPEATHQVAKLAGGNKPTGSIKLAGGKK